ncbi:carbon-nitrogen family hydrolase [Evansella sp. AB-P1]|uniref:carbon-nitrogen family hydrolase n=1 Tax=Evansella sp. AB-P1 TaxID=3037653 RepID=UPI00241C181A|nr:carbon-nitrogen family hydrolase [Evansella sp. AB-P1]MDG5790069.1 carbon-nitrogen family hydrolase [Evansella sp. AB-P1]
MWKVALLQMNIAFGDPKTNFEQVENFFTKAVKKKVDTIILPEMWSTGYELTRLDDIADEEGEETLYFLYSLAKKYHVNIVGGSIAKRSNGKVTNTMFVLNKKGELVKEYSKAHLFRLMDEEKYLVEGNSDGLFELEGETCAGVICYDIRFPEWIRMHMTQEAKVLFVVAEWPKPRINHWRNLLISRAIENQCYVVACNRVGSDPNNVFGGQSIIVDPWGNVKAEGDEEEQILYGEIDFNQVDEVRKKIPVFTDRRTDLYKL